MIFVAIVDDQRDIRDGLQKVIDQAEGFCCRQAYPDARSALQGISEMPPDIVLLDIQLPDMCGIECLRQLKRSRPDLEVVVLTAHSEDESVFGALQAGACGFLTKNVFPSRVLSALREVHRGGAPLSPAVARRVVSSFYSFQHPLTDLSDREEEVLQLLCRGQSYREIAGRLYVSPNTVRFHLKNIYKKMRVNSRHEAVAKAMGRLEGGIVNGEV